MPNQNILSYPLFISSSPSTDEVLDFLCSRYEFVLYNHNLLPRKHSLMLDAFYSYFKKYGF